MELSPQEIRERLLDLLLRFDKLCKENDIKYFLAYGTCLGAVRHKGFIPWDDDVDVVVPREDFNKLISLKGGDGFKILSPYADKKYYYSFIKISDTSTSLVENHLQNDFDLGLYVDVFPMDNLPNNLNERTKFMTKIYKMVDGIYYAVTVKNKIQFTGNCFQRICKRIKRCFIPRVIKENFLRIKYKIIGPNKLAKKINKVSVKYNVQNTGYMAYIDPNKKYFCNWTRELFDNSTMVEFCGHLFPAPSDVDKYLRLTYGENYMVVPPVEKQIRHNISVKLKD